MSSPLGVFPGLAVLTSRRNISTAVAKRSGAERVPPTDLPPSSLLMELLLPPHRAPRFRLRITPRLSSTP